MKKALCLLLVLVLLLGLAGCQQDESIESIKGFHWGASADEVRSWHKGKMKDQMIGMLEAKCFGLDCSVAYYFTDDDKLSGVNYGFKKDVDEQKNVERYDMLRALTLKKYGEPEYEREEKNKHTTIYYVDGLIITLILSEDVFLLSYMN